MVYNTCVIAFFWMVYNSCGITLFWVQIAFCPGTRGRDEGWCGDSFLGVCFCLFVCPFQQCVPVVIVINHIILSNYKYMWVSNLKLSSIDHDILMFAIDWQFPVHFSKCHTNSYYSEKYFIGTLFTRDSLGAYINSVTSAFVLLFILSPYFF